MNGKRGPQVYLHCGPPKTATTGLQYALQSGNKSFFYGGVFQPRSLNSKAYSDFLLSAVSAKNFEPNYLSETLAGIRRKLDNGVDVVISEEMFLVDGVVSHQEKIRRLSQIFRDFPVKPVICLRDPVDGLPSLYQQLYGSLPLSQKFSFQRFLASNQAKIFDYKHVNDLFMAEFGGVRLVSFRDLVTNELMLSDIFGRDYLPDAKILLGKVNISVRNSNGRTLKPIRIQNVFPIESKLSPLFPVALKERMKRVEFLQFARRSLTSVTIAPQLMRQLIVPKELAEDLRGKWMALMRSESELDE